MELISTTGTKPTTRTITAPEGILTSYSPMRYAYDIIEETQDDIVGNYRVLNIDGQEITFWAAVKA